MKIFGNVIGKAAETRAVKQKIKFAKKFGYDPQTTYTLSAEPNRIIGEMLGVKNLVLSDEGDRIDDRGGIVVGTVRLGYGHYRTAIAAASAANSMGLTPYWLDLMSFKNAPAGKIIGHLNRLHSIGSRFLQKNPIFNRLYWEPAAKSSRKLDSNAGDFQMSELMSQVYYSLPETLPVVATHSWPAQAAIHAGMKRVINMIPDNWPLSLNLAEGALHTVQSPSSYFGYRTLKNMDPKRQVLNPMPAEDIRCTGHYVDHEIAGNIEKDCGARIKRIDKKNPRRILLTADGEGDQAGIIKSILFHLIPFLKNDEIVLFLNSGDQKNIFEMANTILNDSGITVQNYTDWDETTGFVRQAAKGNAAGAHNFCHRNMFAAVYATNLLMRHSDFIMTSPGALAFYPVPKIILPRLGGHEAWGAVRSAEIGDGTVECETIPLILQALDLMLHENDLLTMFCENIITQNKIGTYDGAYNVIRLATARNLRKRKN